MKASSILLLVSGASASYDTLSQPTKYTQPVHPPQHKYVDYAPQPKEKTVYAKPYDFEVEAPYPFMKFPSSEVQIDNLSIPELGSYHCFLVGAPWSKCGRRSLTSYFLDQCMAFHWLMTKSVDGICGGAPPATPEPIPIQKNYGYHSEHYDATTTTPAPKPADEIYKGVGTGYGRTITDDYLKEKCLQKAFVSITTATVQCLTENSIRIKYIEHYAQDAATNPIEGPTLYLKKLHEFIDEVIECTSTTVGEVSKEVTNFPTLYTTSKNYNPNSPFYLDSYDQVSLYQYTNGPASGLEAYTLGPKGTATSFLCANPKHLEVVGDHYEYTSLPNSHYIDYRKDGFSTFSSAATALGTEKLVRKCTSMYDNQYITGDLSLRNLYDAVHPYENDITTLRRPKTIAEIAVSGAGMIEQPLLEGFGIMYYCAFYACKANNGGNTDGTCFPSFEGDDEFQYDSLTTNLATFKEEAHEVNKCIEDHWLKAHEIAEISAEFNLALKRSYICMTENTNVEFLNVIVSGWSDKNDAVAYVYGRHLADEKSYEDAKDLCASNDVLYGLLEDTLADLKEKCQENKDAHVDKKIEEHYKKQTYAHYGYH